MPETIELDIISDPSVVADFHLPGIGDGHGWSDEHSRTYLGPECP
jgi:hypothetical protein